MITPGAGEILEYLEEGRCGLLTDHLERSKRYLGWGVLIHTPERGDASSRKPVGGDEVVVASELNAMLHTAGLEVASGVARYLCLDSVG